MTSQVFFFFFFSSLGIDSVTDLQWLEWVLALISPLSPVKHCEVREMSASCFLPGACSPSLSCAFLCQSHLCHSHLAWQYYQISPALSISLSLSVSLALSKYALPLIMHCWTNYTFLTVHSHIMVPPAASLTLWFVSVHVQFQCRNSHSSLFVFSPPPPSPPLFLSQEWGSTRLFLSLTWLTT